MREKRVQSAQVFGVDVSMLRCSSSEETQGHVETFKEAFDKLQAQVLALRIRGEETCLTCSTASDLALPRVREKRMMAGILHSFQLFV